MDIKRRARRAQVCLRLCWAGQEKKRREEEKKQRLPLLLENECRQSIRFLSVMVTNRGAFIAWRERRRKTEVASKKAFC